MKIELAQRARTIHADALVVVPATSAGARRLHAASPVRDGAAAAPAYRSNRAMAIAAPSMATTAPFGFALSTPPTTATGIFNPCVVAGKWLEGNKHEHQRLKERSLD